LAEPAYIHQGCGAWRLEAQQDADGFEHAGFPLGIIADEGGGSGAELAGQPVKTSEIFGAQRGKVSHDRWYYH
jgi:hypothetical protein